MSHFQKSSLDRLRDLHQHFKALADIYFQISMKSHFNNDVDHYFQLSQFYRGFENRCLDLAFSLKYPRPFGTLSHFHLSNSYYVYSRSIERKARRIF